MDCRPSKADTGGRRPREVVKGGQVVGDQRNDKRHGTRAGRPRLRRAGAVALLAALLSGLLSSAAITPASAGLLPPPPPPLKVIVQQLNPNDPAPAALIALNGGTITQQLPIVTGFAATIPSTLLRQLASLPGVRAVTGDQPVVPASVADTVTPGPSVHRETIGSSDANAAGITGAGSTVAVLDTGIADVAPLSDNLPPIGTR